MISIIIPVYNVAAYLDECISSVVEQTFTNWECILVNDGSTDASGKICNRWAQKDSRIKVVHQENKGVSAARNKGISLAQGEYITFIDSDDWVEKEYLEDMYNAPKADVIVSGITRNTLNEGCKEFIPSKNIKINIDTKDADIFVELNEKFLIFSPCIKLYKKEIIKKHKIEFPTEYSLGEDLEFNFKYLEYTQTISCVAKSNYHYRITGNNTLSTRLRYEQFSEDYLQWKTQKEFYIKKGIWVADAKRLLYTRLWEVLHDGIFRFSQLKDADINYLKFMRKIPEIEELKKHKELYPCSSWIKWAILNKAYYIFYGYFILHRIKNSICSL